MSESYRINGQAYNDTYSEAPATMQFNVFNLLDEPAIHPENGYTDPLMRVKEVQELYDIYNLPAQLGGPETTHHVLDARGRQQLPQTD